jgi:hypothetical protein
VWGDATVKKLCALVRCRTILVILALWKRKKKREKEGKGFVVRGGVLFSVRPTNLERVQGVA